MCLFQSELLAYEAEERAVVEPVFQREPWRGPFASCATLHVVALAGAQCAAEQALPCRRGMFYLLHHACVDFLPEARHRCHACGVRLAHRLLYVVRPCVDDKLSPLGHGEEGPPAFEDMCVGQEVHHAVVFSHGHTLMVGAEGGVILAVGEYHSLRVARGAAGVEYVGYVVFGSLCPQPFHLALPRQSAAQAQKLVEAHGGVVLRV